MRGYKYHTEKQLYYFEEKHITLSINFEEKHITLYTNIEEKHICDIMVEEIQWSIFGGRYVF